MSGQSLTVRFPTQTEFWYSENVPAVGDVVERNGSRYVVTSSEKAGDERYVVTLELDSPDRKPPHPSG